MRPRLLARDGPLHRQQPLLPRPTAHADPRAPHRLRLREPGQLRLLPVGRLPRRVSQQRRWLLRLQPQRGLHHSVQPLRRLRPRHVQLRGLRHLRGLARAD